MMPEKPVAGLMADLLSEDEMIRQSAETSLEDYSANLVIPEISALLRSPEKDVRTRGMELFCCVGKDAVPSLAGLLADGEWTVRYRAAEALGIIGGDAACAYLIPVLQDSRDHVRYMAAKGLGISSCTDCADKVALLLTDENEFVRGSAARALGQMNLTAYSAAIKDALQREMYDKTRIMMSEALVRLGGD